MVNMKTFCTLSDKKYLRQGLALFESLLDHEKSFGMYYLCLDDETYRSIEGVKNSKLHPIHIKDVERENEALLKYRDSQDYTHYCWALASSLVCHIRADDILYMDSDLYFYTSTDLIYQEIGDKSIGIITHRKNVSKVIGEYNVGIVYFRNDHSGASCRTFWNDLVLNPDNKYFDNYGSCGDQKYLELFEREYPGSVCVIDDLVGHGAPWNWHKQHCEADAVTWKGNRQKLVFNHFSHFTPDFENGTYKTSFNGEWNPKGSATKKYYDDYFEVLKKVDL